MLKHEIFTDGQRCFGENTSEISKFDQKSEK